MLADKSVLLILSSKKNGKKNKKDNKKDANNSKTTDPKKNRKKMTELPTISKKKQKIEKNTPNSMLLQAGRKSLVILTFVKEREKVQKISTE